MNKVITFGEIMMRLSPNGYYRFFQNDQMQATFGGAEANVAVSLANFNTNTAFITKVPDNPIGHAAITSLKCFGVDTSNIVYGGKRLGIYFMEKGYSQRGSICIYDRAYSSFAESELSDYNWEKIFENANWFHFTGITPALSDSMAHICELACQEAKRKGLKISCDINYRSKLWSKENAFIVMNNLCKYVDICILNEEDAKSVFGIESSNTDKNYKEIDKTDYIYIAQELAERYGFEHVAITLRKSITANHNNWSGMLYDGTNCWFSKEYDLSIIDRIGGGDSFAAGLIFSLLNNKNSKDAIEFAVAASALKHSIEGDFNRVTIAEVEQIVTGNSSGRVQR